MRAGRMRTAVRTATDVWAFGIAGVLSQFVWLLLNGVDHGSITTTPLASEALI